MTREELSRIVRLCNFGRLMDYIEIVQKSKAPEDVIFYERLVEMFALTQRRDHEQAI